MLPIHTTEHCIIACAEAYDSAHYPGAVEVSARRDWHCSRCDHVTHVDAFARVAVHGSRALVAFRGTDSPLDWWANTDMRRCSRYGGHAHAGFAHAYDSLAEDIAEALPHGQLAAITFAGHSLGGAMAALAALDAIDAYPGCYIDLVTFGAPRCLSACLAARLADTEALTISRYVNGPDPVTWLPPLAATYRHAGDAIQLRRYAAALAVGNWFAGRLLHRRYHPIAAYWTAMQEGQR
jgi:predicted lipase